MRDLVTTTKTISHPLEEFLEIKTHSTEITVNERKTQVSEYENYDEKEQEIEQDFQEILDMALTSFNKIGEIIETADTKLVARLTEVQMQTLNTAMSAAEKKKSLKENKDRHLAKLQAQSGKKQGDVHNNLTVVNMSQNDMLAMLRDKMGVEGTNLIQAEYSKEE